MKFPSGQLVVTAGVNERQTENAAFAVFVAQSLARHFEGDWGDLCQEDQDRNEEALKDGSRLLSAYEQPGLPKIWIITEWDRSVTTVLFPDEY